MLKNYFKTAFRNLSRYTFYTIINVAGLGIGIAAMVWGFQNYRYSFSFDRFHPDIDHVYRGLTFRQGAEGVQGSFPMAAVRLASNEFPGISKAVRLHKLLINIKTGKAETFTEAVSFTDPGFFQLFNFPLVKGKSDLLDESAVVITQRTAIKYFGAGDPIGKTLLFYAGERYSFPLTVTGVVKDPPMNSTIQFDFLTGFKNLILENGKKMSEGDWGMLLNSAAYFKIPHPEDVRKAEGILAGYQTLQNKAREDWKVSGFKLITLRENAALCNVVRSSLMFQRPTDAAAYGPIVTSLLILLCVCLNFSNTTVARASGRLKEIGMRKVMGSTHAQLVCQMLLECSLIVLFAILLSVIINNWWLPAFNKMFVYVDVQANYLHDLPLSLFVGSMLVVTVIMAGAYPAFYISRFNPSTIFRGSIKFGGSNLFSRIMLGLQIAISLIAVIGGIGFARNAEFEKGFDFGYNVQNNIGISVKDENHFNVLKNEMAKIPQVTAMAGTRDNIGFTRRHEVSEAAGAKKETMFLEVGGHYLDLMKMKLVAGRELSDSLQGDYSHSILVTEKYAALFGWRTADALGKSVRIDTGRYNIVGVLKDFHPVTLFEPSEPVVVKLARPESYGSLVIQAPNGDLHTVQSLAKNIWKKLFPLEPYNGYYQDEIVAHSYDTSSAIASIFSGLAVVTVLLSAAGLFALISLTLLKRMREIALRKVVGARPSDIYLLMNKVYFWIVLAGVALGGYGGWTLSRSLLDQIFAVNAGISLTTIGIAVVSMMVIAFTTTGIKIAQAISTNPVRLLRMD
ncbi:MAG TPA: ABC transporter permease [Puia sp.]|nr:ABC transporter permease [Puia sp.]